MNDTKSARATALESLPGATAAIVCGPDPGAHTRHVEMFPGDDLEDIGTELGKAMSETRAESPGTRIAVLCNDRIMEQMHDLYHECDAAAAERYPAGQGDEGVRITGSLDHEMKRGPVPMPGAKGRAEKLVAEAMAGHHEVLFETQR